MPREGTTLYSPVVWRLEMGPLGERSRAENRKAASAWGSIWVLTNIRQAFSQGRWVETKRQGLVMTSPGTKRRGLEGERLPAA